MLSFTVCFYSVIRITQNVLVIQLSYGLKSQAKPLDEIKLLASVKFLDSIRPKANSTEAELI